MLRLLRWSLYALILILVFVVGLFSSDVGIFAILTGNVRTQVDVNSVLSSVEALSQLTTTRYVYTNQITASRDLPDILAVAFGEQLVMEANGHINAGIDLTKLEAEDVRQDGNVLFINLPAPELQDCFFNEQSSRILEQRAAIFSNYPEDLQIAARKIAIQNFRDQAIEDGIFEEARIQSEIAITEFVMALIPNLESVRVVTDPIDPNAPLPLTCQ